MGADRDPGAAGEALPCAQVECEGGLKLGHAAALCGDVDGGRVEGLQRVASCPLHRSVCVGGQVDLQAAVQRT